LISRYFNDCVIVAFTFDPTGLSAEPVDRATASRFEGSAPLSGIASRGRATALTAPGPEDAMALAEREGLAAHMVVRGRELLSSGLEAMLG